jgi:hypothetical protein
MQLWTGAQGTPGIHYRTLCAKRTDSGCRNLLRWPCCQNQQCKPRLCSPGRQQVGASIKLSGSEP